MEQKANENFISVTITTFVDNGGQCTPIQKESKIITYIKRFVAVSWIIHGGNVGTYIDNKSLKVPANYWSNCGGVKSWFYHDLQNIV